MYPRAAGVGRGAFEGEVTLVLVAAALIVASRSLAGNTVGRVRAGALSFVLLPSAGNLCVGWIGWGGMGSFSSDEAGSAVDERGGGAVPKTWSSSPSSSTTSSTSNFNFRAFLAEASFSATILCDTYLAKGVAGPFRARFLSAGEAFLLGEASIREPPAKGDEIEGTALRR
jgi:hypothetical protein